MKINNYYIMKFRYLTGLVVLIKIGDTWVRKLQSFFIYCLLFWLSERVKFTKYWMTMHLGPIIVLWLKPWLNSSRISRKFRNHPLLNPRRFSYDFGPSVFNMIFNFCQVQIIRLGCFRPAKLKHCLLFSPGLKLTCRRTMVYGL